MTQENIKKMDVRKWYLSNFEIFEKHLNGNREVPFHHIRKAAIQKFAELGFPTTRDEEWRFTNIAPLLQHHFKVEVPAVHPDAEMISPFLFEGVKENVLVFVNGRFNESLSRIYTESEKLTVKNLDKLLQEDPQLVEAHLSRYAGFEDDTFVALNTAFVKDGTVIYVASHAVVEEPVHLINISMSREEEFVSYPRNLIIAEEGSKVRFIESYHSFSEVAYFNDVVTEIFVDENARVEHLKFQEEGLAGYHIANTRVHQKKNSVYSFVGIDLGGKIVRHNLHVVFEGEYAEANLYGIYLGTDRQLIDNHTLMDHAVPNCNSNELFKGILTDRAHGVFNGKIMVRPDAQKTNAFQKNKTLLLSNDAVINAKPQLEIFADDVKCTHGATIGQIDPEALFYLRARGIPEKTALAMLRYAFVSDVLEYIPIEAIRSKIDSIILKKFHKIEEME